MLHWVVTKHAGEQFYLEMPHRLYYEFSVRSFTKVQEFRPILAASLNDKSQNGTEKQHQLLYENRLAMNDVLIYAALSLEAYINYYAMRYDVPFHRDLEKSLSTINKWKMYTNTKTRKTIDQRAIEIIKKIFRLRDDIVHPKPQRIKARSEAPNNNKNAQGQIESLDKGQLIIDLNSVYKAVFKIDKDENADYINIPWLSELKKVD